MYKNVPGGKIFLFGVDGNGVEGVDGWTVIIGTGRFDETTFGELLFASISNFPGLADPFSSPDCFDLVLIWLWKLDLNMVFFFHHSSYLIQLSQSKEDVKYVFDLIVKVGFEHGFHFFYILSVPHIWFGRHWVKENHVQIQLSHSNQKPNILFWLWKSR